MEKYLDIFPVLSVAFVTVDREFVGKEWLSYLRRMELKFRIRIRHSVTLSNGRGKAIAGRVLFAHLPINSSEFLPKRRRLCRDYEELPEHHEGLIFVTMIRLMLLKLTHNQRTRSSITVL